MKTFIMIQTWMAVVAFLMAGPSVQAREFNLFYMGKSQVGITADAAKEQLQVKVLNIGSEPIRITIFDLKHQSLLEETVTAQQQINKIYDLKNLPEGKYYISFSKSLMETVQPFYISSKGVRVDAADRLQKYAPSIRKKGELLDIDLLLNQFSQIQVSIYDASGKVVFSEKHDQTIVLNRSYDLKGIPPGEYTIELRAASEVFYKTFEVK